jgi:ETC complex I subunit-like protein
MRQERIIGPGHNQPPQETAYASWLHGAEALITHREWPVTTAGRAHAHEWVLRFERRTPPEIEPLMGWTGGSDTLASQVELRFDTLGEAVAYAERQGLSFRIQHEPRVTLLRAPKPECKEAGAHREHARADEALGAVISLAFLEAPYGRCDLSTYTDLEQVLVNPATVFARPDEVVRHPLLSLTCKREILWRWAWDEYLIEVAQAEGMPEGPPSQLGEVRTALQALGSEWSPDPAAPAMRIHALWQEGTGPTLQEETALAA